MSLYAVSGLVIATVAGLALGRICPTRWVEPFVGHALEKLTRQALADLHAIAEITNVTDYPTILGYG